MDSGVYIAAFHLSGNRKIQVGRLGVFEFPAGIYYYVGSAQRNLHARLDRHARKDKPLQWHVDYLSARGRMLGAIVFDGAKNRECELAEELSQLCVRPMKRFGASDCRCGGHLFYSLQLE